MKHRLMRMKGVLSLWRMPVCTWSEVQLPNQRREVLYILCMFSKRDYATTHFGYSSDIIYKILVLLLHAPFTSSTTFVYEKKKKNAKETCLYDMSFNIMHYIQLSLCIGGIFVLSIRQICVYYDTVYFLIQMTINSSEEKKSTCF